MKIKFDECRGNRYVAKFQDVKIIFIDEAGRLSNVMLMFLHQILIRAKQNTKFFGGVDIILTGDSLQNSPVKADPFCYPLKALTLLTQGCQ